MTQGQNGDRGERDPKVCGQCLRVIGPGQMREHMASAHPPESAGEVREPEPGDAKTGPGTA